MTTIFMQVISVLKLLVGTISKWVMCPKAKPELKTVSNIRLVICRGTTCFHGMLLVRNGGSIPFSITNIVVRCKEFNLPYNLVAVNHWPGNDVHSEGTQKLPLTVEGNVMKQVFFHTEEISKAYKGDENVTLEITFDCKPKVICKTLCREDDTNHYSLNITQGKSEKIQ